MQLETFTVNELKNNIDELSDNYQKFNSLQKINWPKKWVDEYRKKTDEVKRREFKIIYDLTLNRYTEGVKKWFDDSGKVKNKFKNILTSFYGSILWLNTTLKKLYNDSSDLSQQ